MTPLQESRVILDRVARRVQGVEIASPEDLECRVKLSELMGRQQYLEEMETGLTQRGPKGFGLPILIPIIAGGVLVVGAFSGWIYKQRLETQQMDMYTECLAERQAEGMSVQQASKICYPFGGLMDIVTKAGILLGGLAVLYFVTKL